MEDPHGRLVGGPGDARWRTPPRPGRRGGADGPRLDPGERGPSAPARSDRGNRRLKPRAEGRRADQSDPAGRGRSQGGRGRSTPPEGGHPHPGISSGRRADLDRAHARTRVDPPPRDGEGFRSRAGREWAPPLGCPPRGGPCPAPTHPDRRRVSFRIEAGDRSRRRHPIRGRSSPPAVRLGGTRRDARMVCLVRPSLHPKRPRRDRALEAPGRGRGWEKAGAKAITEGNCDRIGIPRRDRVPEARRLVRTPRRAGRIRPARRGGLRDHMGAAARRTAHPRRGGGIPGRRPGRSPHAPDLPATVRHARGPARPGRRARRSDGGSDRARRLGAVDRARRRTSPGVRPRTRRCRRAGELVPPRARADPPGARRGGRRVAQGHRPRLPARQPGRLARRGQALSHEDSLASVVGRL